MARKGIRRGVEPPVRSGHAPVTQIGKARIPMIFWYRLDKATVNEIREKGFKEIAIQLPTGETVVKRVRPRNLFQGDKICIYRRSTGEWSLRDFAADRKRVAKHSPERLAIVDKEGEIVSIVSKGMTGDRSRGRRRKRSRRKRRKH